MIVYTPRRKTNFSDAPSPSVFPALPRVRGRSERDRWRLGQAAILGEDAEMRDSIAVVEATVTPLAGIDRAIGLAVDAGAMWDVEQVVAVVTVAVGQDH